MLPVFIRKIKEKTLQQPPLDTIEQIQPAAKNEVNAIVKTIFYLFQNRDISLQ